MPTIDRRKTNSGENRWRARVRRKGYSEARSFGRRTDARQWAREVERAIDRGEWHKVRTGGRLTFGELLDDYLVDIRPDKDYRRHLKWWREQIKADSPAAVPRAKIIQLRGKLTRGTTVRGGQRSPATANRYMAALSAVYSWGVERSLVTDHPVRGIKRLAEAQERERHLIDDEQPRLLSACRASSDPRLYPLVHCALASGARRGELLGLKWRDVQLDSDMVRAILHKTKNRDRRPLFFPGEAGGLLRKMARTPHISGYVFAKPSGRPEFPRKAWEKALRDAEVKDFRFHDLRHTTASYLAMSGIPLVTVGEILGHRSVQMVKRYSHHTDAYKSDALALMSERFLQNGS